MHRLTEWRDGHGSLLCGDGYTKLARYEDSGLEPGEIIEKLAKLENDNRALRLFNDALEKRLRHLLQSKIVEEYDHINPHTGEYERDISGLDRILAAARSDNPLLIFPERIILCYEAPREYDNQERTEGSHR